MNGGLIKNWVSYPWRIEHASQRLGSETMTVSPQFRGAGVGRTWQMMLVSQTEDGTNLQNIPLFVFVADPSSLVINASISAQVLVRGSETVAAVNDRRLVIDLVHGKMGAVLVDEKFLPRQKLSDDGPLTIRCRIEVFDDDMDSFFQPGLPLPPRFRHVLPGIRQWLHGEDSDDEDPEGKDRDTDSLPASIPAKRQCTK